MYSLTRNGQKTFHHFRKEQQLVLFGHQQDDGTDVLELGFMKDGEISVINAGDRGVIQRYLHGDVKIKDKPLQVDLGVLPVFQKEGTMNPRIWDAGDYEAKAGDELVKFFSNVNKSEEEKAEDRQRNRERAQQDAPSIPEEECPTDVPSPAQEEVVEI